MFLDDAKDLKFPGYLHDSNIFIDGRELMKA